MAYERLHPDQPWLTRAMIEILDSWLRSDDVGLEFGSGRSTSWFAKRVGHLTSVEHNPRWYESVRDSLRSEGVTLAERVDYLLHEDGVTNGESTRYVNVANSAKPESLDFCLIDGMARDHCALACLDKIKPGGILIIDNVEGFIPREIKSIAPNSRTLKDGYASDVWLSVSKQLTDWRSIWTTNGIWDSALWVRPLQ